MENDFFAVPSTELEEIDNSENKESNADSKISETADLNLLDMPEEVILQILAYLGRFSLERT